MSQEGRASLISECFLSIRLKVRRVQTVPISFIIIGWPGVGNQEKKKVNILSNPRNLVNNKNGME